MKKNEFKFLVFLLSLFIMISVKMAQAQDSSIRFQHGLTWQQIKEKAKAQNKYIFMDCYATWCSPCKWMDQNVFSQKSVADYFNNKFINVEVQMDKTPKDSQAIKDWYSDAKKIAQNYDVTGFPTFLFFDPNGNIVHRIVGIVQNPDEFIENANLAFNHSMQYESVKTEWKSHLKDTVYLLKALNTVIKASDKLLFKDIGIAYINALHNPITQENIKWFTNRDFIASSDDVWFQIAVKNVTLINKITGNEHYVQNGIVGEVIYNEDIIPILANDSKPVYWKDIIADLQMKYPTLCPKLIDFEKEQLTKYIIRQEIGAIINKKNAPAADWEKISQILNDRFPDFKLRPILLKEESNYYSNQKNWIKSAEVAYTLLRDYGSTMDKIALNQLIWYNIVLYCDDKNILLEALKWMKKAEEQVDKNNIKQYVVNNDVVIDDTYANLLYKLGQKEEAMHTEEQVIKLIRDGGPSLQLRHIGYYEEVLKKMNFGLPTWGDDNPKF